MDEKIMYAGIAIVAIIVVIGAISLFSGNSGESNTVSSPSSSTPQAMENNQGGNEGNSGSNLEEDVRVITVDGSEFRFTPNEIKVNKGERVRVVFRNTGQLPHDFVIEGTSLRTRIIGPGETDVIEFTASETKTYTFYCSVGSHRQNGMEGMMAIQ